MIKDPLTSWPGAFPYDVLARVGVTPASPMTKVQDASFALMQKGLMNQTARNAWEELRFVARRLAVDFFMVEEPAKIPAPSPVPADFKIDDLLEEALAPLITDIWGLAEAMCPPGPPQVDAVDIPKPTLDLDALEIVDD